MKWPKRRRRGKAPSKTACAKQRHRRFLASLEWPPLWMPPDVHARVQRTIFELEVAYYYGRAPISFDA